MITTISLAAGQQHLLNAADLNIQVEVELSPPVPWQLIEPDSATVRSSPRVGILVKDVLGDTDLRITPVDAPRFGSTVQAHTSLLAREEGLRIEFPVLTIGGQSSATLIRLVRQGNQVAVLAPEPTGMEELDAASATIRQSVASLQENSPPRPASGPRPILIVLDESASFTTQVSEEQRQAMASFVGAVIGEASFTARIVGTSAESHSQECTGPGDLAAYFTSAAQRAEVGWTRSFTQFEFDGFATAAALVVLSDDLPGQFLNDYRPVHLIATRPPSGPIPPQVSVTLIDEAFTTAVRNQDQAVLAPASQDMFRALTVGQAG
ncbi:MAG TPA: hypothetical protein VFC72_02645 [Corynebacterium sp.]|nr:hypothetical protein [Corynebacterium sp.]